MTTQLDFPTLDARPWRVRVQADGGHRYTVIVIATSEADARHKATSIHNVHPVEILTAVPVTGSERHEHFG
jgi:hypothetical protein